MKKGRDRAFSLVEDIGNPNTGLFFTDIAASADGSVCASSSNGPMSSLLCLDGTSTVSEEMPADLWTVRAIAFDEDGTLLAAGGRTEGELWSKRDGQWSRMATLEESPVTLLSTSGAEITAASASGGVYRGTAQEVSIAKAEIACGAVKSLCANGANDAMAVCETGEVLRLSDRAWTSLKRDRPFSATPTEQFDSAWSFGEAVVRLSCAGEGHGYALTHSVSCPYDDTTLVYGIDDDGNWSTLGTLKQAADLLFGRGDDLRLVASKTELKGSSEQTFHTYDGESWRHLGSESPGLGDVDRLTDRGMCVLGSNEALFPSPSGVVHYSAEEFAAFDESSPLAVSSVYATSTDLVYLSTTNSEVYRGQF